MAAISFSGLASGIDSSALIKTLLDQQRSARIKPLQNKVSDLTDTSDKLKELKGLALKLSSAIDGFRTLSGGVVARKVSSSDEGIVSASASNTAAAGSYSLTVNQLAKNATASFSDRYSASTSAINSAINAGASAVDRTVSVTIGNGAEQEIVNVELTSTTTLDQFVTEFNESSTKATAAIVNVGTSASPSYAISFTTSNSGLDKGQVAINVGAEITSAGAGALSATTVSQALDANFSISGISGSITRSTNTVSDVLAGISLNLQTTGSANITVSTDSARTTSAVKGVVDAYNEIVAYIKENNAVTRQEDGAAVSNLFAPLAVSRVDDSFLSTLRGALSSSGASGSTISVLADLGVTTQRDGTLAFNSATLASALESDPQGVQAITQRLGDAIGGPAGAIAQFTRFNGLFDQTVTSNTTQVSTLNNRINTVEQALARQEQTLVAQYSRLESVIGRLNSQQSALSSLLPR